MGYVLVYFCVAGRSAVGLSAALAQPSLLSDQDREAL